MNAFCTTATSLPQKKWMEVSRRHYEKASAFTLPVRKRRDKGESHPIEDFLFDYYPYPIALIEQWHPGLGVLLEIENPETLPTHLLGKRYRVSQNTCHLDHALLQPKDRSRLQWISSLLVATQNHQPIFSCHGLHEWAMVYQAEEIRHSSIAPLRIPQEEIDTLVESRTITCSHHDAFRFFSKSARSFNRLQPNIETRHFNEQPGCVHANMDLYKWAAKSMPWIGSEIFFEIFLLAMELRDLDMRASPYDLAAWNLIPVKIETPAGRKLYETEQRRLATKAFSLRARLIESLETICSATR
ncbi:MAG: 3-methyladenine DNA glycosylase [Luteolibacter sp.]